MELKNGETYNGHLVSCDNWMNINLREVICTSRDGDKFWRMPECYIRGSTIKYLRIPDEVIDMVKEETLVKNKQAREQKGGRGMQNQRNRPAARGKCFMVFVLSGWWSFDGFFRQLCWRQAKQTSRSTK